VRLTDVTGTEVYDREGSESGDPGLDIDNAPRRDRRGALTFATTAEGEGRHNIIYCRCPR
jgi:hypothetical protein